MQENYAFIFAQICIGFSYVSTFIFRLMLMKMEEITFGCALKFPKDYKSKYFTIYKKDVNLLGSSLHRKNKVKEKRMCNLEILSEQIIHRNLQY